MSDLKPCPFCDSRAEHYSFNYRKHTVRCSYCLADCGEHDTPERAAFVWNTRPAEYALTAEVERLKAELNNALMILKQLDWLYSEENENARMWELSIGGLSPTEWMCDIVRKSREFIANAPDTNDGRMK